MNQTENFKIEKATSGNEALENANAELKQADLKIRPQPEVVPEHERLKVLLERAGVCLSRIKSAVAEYYGLFRFDHAGSR